MLAFPHLLFALILQGQKPSAVQAPAARGPGVSALELARKSFAAGDASRALEHIQRARAVLPDSLEPIELALQVRASDGDERALWSYAWLETAANAKGQADAPTNLKTLLDTPPWLEHVVRARAAAVAELAKFASGAETAAGMDSQQALVARWARQVATDLAAPSPALRATLPPYTGWTSVTEALQMRTLRALEKQMLGALDSGKTADGARAARVLRGLCVQSEFKDLQGSHPRSLATFAKSATAALARARAQLLIKSETPWVVADLEWLTSDEGDAFTRAHADFGIPAVALSPESRYRIETDCGLETLRGVAETIEMHHRRLATWYGSDPFLQRQGLVRVVPEASGLESEGSPFWWAGGFQSGDVTTVRFSCGTLDGLGHGLTHELTHRFDGALFPGIPSWLAEGRAVWTGGAFARADDESFVAHHASFGTIEAAFIKGYGALDKLEKLVGGTLEDYRDNYTAGYALYVYLSTWDMTKQPVFAAQLAEYMKRCANSKVGQRELFEQTFCDGKAGRPKDLAAFAADFGVFIAGFYWRDRKPFTEGYVTEVGAAGGEGYVYDSPTWVWSRARAEPFFGQGQALAAARILAAAGDEGGAIEAYTWALAADGRSPLTEREFEKLTARHRDDIAFCLRSIRRFPQSCATADEAPFAMQLPRLRELESALIEARDACVAAGHACAAQRFAAERERLAAQLGLSPKPIPVVSKPAIGPSAFGSNGRWLSVGGYVEDGLTGYEEKRVRELWYAEPNGDLHVGRARPRAGTGEIDRNSAQQDAFTRSKEWNLPGAWRFDARLRFTTSYASAAVVLGYQRREQGVRFSFSGGDFLFAIGASDKEPSFESLSWNLDGGFERDGALGSGLGSGGHNFGGSRTSFELSLVVDGPRVDAFIDGEHVGSYCNTDGSPIQGYVGFATSMGAIVVQEASVRRLDFERAVGPPRMTPNVLALAGGPSVSLRDATGAPMTGFEAPSQGALLVIVPTIATEGEEATKSDAWLARLKRWGDGIADELERSPRSQPVLLCVPRGLPPLFEPTIADINKRFSALGVGRAGILEHGLVHDAEDVASFGRTPWVIFVDSYGIVRRGGSYSGLSSVYENREWRHWLDVFRENGLPARDLPMPKRGSEGTPAGK
ncbi:MAG TPA: hypothetical protein VK843_22070 [Planctomycetota bacterium]|nr:hypothetical protein [Planctomycetota bacterium]